MKTSVSIRRLASGCFIAVAGMFLAMPFQSCEEKKEVVTQVAFNPSLPVKITRFTPDAGGTQEPMIIYGENFGCDKSMVKVTIGGRNAVVVNVQNDKLYCIVPALAFAGDVVITITDEKGVEHTATAAQTFAYEAQTVVGTLCGYRNDNDSQGERWGSFDVCTGFSSEGCLTIDPKNPDFVYIIYDGSNKIAKLDLAKREASLLMSGNKFQNQRLRNADFTNDGKYMIVSTDRADQGEKSTSLWIVTRNADGSFSDRSDVQPLAAFKQCNGVAVHPVNGEVYFNSYSNGNLFRLDLNDYFRAKNPDPSIIEPKPWTGYITDGAFSELFKIKDPMFEFQIVIHPSGNYAYLVVINQHYILRTDYNWSKKEFMTPYIVCGSYAQRSWVDAVGTSARVNRPYQGWFVKNPKYEAEGRADVYDFYFADCLNFCIRSMTPEGIVRTYAGRSPSTNGNIWGTEDGALRTASRFRDVSGLCYDTKRERFYVLDHNNRSVRFIGKESAEDVVEPTPETPAE